MNSNKIIDNRYITRKIIGKGGMGLVYQVKDIMTGNSDIALKTIKSSSGEKNELLNRFKIEFEIMTRLKHPNLVQVYDYGYDHINDIPYITMEYIKGHTLKEFLKLYASIPLDRILDIIINILRGMEFMHSRDIISRDIKPSNIIIGSDQVKLMDFGISDLGSPEKNKIKGSILYIPPESFFGGINHRSDIYSLGIVFYEILTGKSFYTFKNTKTITKLLNDREAFLENKKKALESIAEVPIRSIIDKMISFDNSSRYRYCSEIIMDINEKLDKNYEIETKKTTEPYILGVNFISRKKELEEMHKRIRKKSFKKLNLITGSTGIGKTRLIEEFKKLCQLYNYHIFTTSSKHDLSAPFQIINEILEQLLIFLPDKEKDIMILKRSLLKNNSKTPLDFDKNDMDLLCQKASNMLIDAGKYSSVPVIICIDDIQWLDRETRDILKYYYNKIKRKKNISLFFFASINPEYDESFSSAKEIGNYDIVNIPSFNSKEIEEYIKGVFGKKHIHKSIKNAISFIRTHIGGNPFFLSEYLRYLLDHNIIIKTKSLWNLTKDIQSIKLPSSIKEIIDARLLEYLKEKKIRRVLQLLSLANTPLNTEEIALILDSSKDNNLRNLLFELERKEILQTRIINNQIKYSISQNLIRERVLNTLDQKERQKLHKIIGKNFEKIFKENIENYYGILAKHFELAGEEKRACHYYEKAGDLHNKKDISLNRLLYYYKNAHDISNTIFHKDSREYLSLSLKLSRVYMDLAEFGKCHDLILNVLEQIKSETEKYSSLLIRAYQLLADYYIAMEDYSSALKFNKKAIGIAEDTHADPRITGNLLHNLGTINYFMHNFDKARSYFYRSIEIKKEAPDDMSIEIGASYNNIGRCYYEIGQFEKAKQIYEDAINIWKDHLWENHPNIASSCYNIGLIYFNLADYKNAVKYHKKALNMRISFFGTDHPDISSSYNSLGNSYLYLNRLKDALRYHKKASRIRLKYLGKDNSQVGASYNNIGTIYLFRKEYDKALQYYQKAIEVWEKNEKNNSQNLTKVFTNMGIIHTNKKEYDEAISYFQKAVQKAELSYNEDHIIYSMIYYNLGEVYLEKEDLNNALFYHQKALRIRLKAFRSSHPLVYQSFDRIGYILMKKDKPKTAILAILRGLSIKLDIDNNHENIRFSYYILALCYEKINDLDKSCEYLKKSLELHNISESDNPHALTEIYEALIRVYEKKGQLKKAKELSQLINSLQ